MREDTAAPSHTHVQLKSMLSSSYAHVQCNIMWKKSFKGSSNFADFSYLARFSGFFPSSTLWSLAVPLHFSVICERSETGQWEGLEAWFTCIIAWCISHECPGMQSNIPSQWCGSVWLGLYIRFDNDSRTFGSSSQDCSMTPHQAIGSIFIN